jgi:hypothetical protein
MLFSSGIRRAVDQYGSSSSSSSEAAARLEAKRAQLRRRHTCSILESTDGGGTATPPITPASLAPKLSSIVPPTIRDQSGLEESDLGRRVVESIHKELFEVGFSRLKIVDPSWNYSQLSLIRIPSNPESSFGPNFNKVFISTLPNPDKFSGPFKSGLERVDCKLNYVKTC